MGPFTPARTHRVPVLLLAITLALAALAMGAPSAAAGQTQPLITFRILVISCDADPGTFPEGEIPTGCTPVEGAAFSIAIAGGETLSCTSNADGRCQVEVPSESQVTVTEDTTTIPAGFTPRENPIDTQAVSEFAGAVFVNVADAPAPESTAAPTAASTDQPTTQLPDTGTGSPSSVSPWFALVTLAILAGMAATTGRRLRR